MLFNKTRGKCSRGVCGPWRQIYFEGDDVLSALESGQEGLIIGEWRAKKRWEVRWWLCLYQANISALTFISSIFHSYCANLLTLLFAYIWSTLLNCYVCLSWPHMVKGSVRAFWFLSVCIRLLHLICSRPPEKRMMTSTVLWAEGKVLVRQ